MTLNGWGIALSVLVALSCIGALVLSAFRKPAPIRSIISEKEDARYLEESIAIQPDNSPVFEEKQAKEVIEDGMQQMRNEKYNMLQGVNEDV